MVNNPEPSLENLVDMVFRMSYIHLSIKKWQISLENLVDMVFRMSYIHLSIKKWQISLALPLSVRSVYKVVESIIWLTLRRW